MCFVFILKAGIQAEQLIVIYDHEAASVCCQYMEAQIPAINRQTIDNTEYIVVKLAGEDLLEIKQEH
jgi:hypothetical protein